MSAECGPVIDGLKRLNALLGWWGLPLTYSRMTDPTIARFQRLLSDLQQTCGEFYGDQLGLLCENHDRTTRAAQDLLRGRYPQALMVMELDFITTCLEVARQHARLWAAVTERTQAYYAGTQSAVSQVSSQAPEPVAPATIADQDRSAVARKSKRPVNA